METGRQRLEQEQDFYRSVDKEARRSWCSCQSLAIFFIVMLAVSSIVVVMLAGKIKDVKTDLSWRNLRFGKKETKVGKVTIYEDDLQARMNGLAGKLIPLDSKRVYIKEDGLYLEGLLKGERLVFVGEPVIKDKKIAIENLRLKDQSLKGKIIPKTIYDGIAKALAASINNNLDNVSEIALKQGKMLLTIF